MTHNSGDCVEAFEERVLVIPGTGKFLRMDTGSRCRGAYYEAKSSQAGSKDSLIAAELKVEDHK